MKNILVTGGCGFIGSHFIEYTLTNYTTYKIINIDKMTYAASHYINHKFKNDDRYKFIGMDINDDEIYDVLYNEDIKYLINFAAETHVDNSLQNAAPFWNSNISGVINLATQCIKYKGIKKFIQISTDEVYGDIPLDSTYEFSENDSLNPSNPYSASKASAELILMSYYRTFNLPLIITRSSNNYGDRQNNEKFIPKTIKNIKKSNYIEIYGNGENIRNWLDVRDNIKAIMKILVSGEIGEIYNIASEESYSNNDVITIIDEILYPRNLKVKYVKDRPGHDLKYSIKNKKLKSLGWAQQYSLEKFLKENLLN